MDTKARNPRELFDGTVCYEIPPFQRPYVWTEEDQWQPLWADIERVAETLASRDDPDDVSPHFLGAVVIKQQSAAAGEPARHSVIDGQQRLTTLQILLGAVQLVTQELGEDVIAETLMELVANPAPRFRGTPRRFKLWPSRIDREAFAAVMDNDLHVTPEQAASRISQAHGFFGRAVREWASAADGSDPELVAARLSLLADVVQQQLVIVCINLDQKDDDQLIFETLNDRGTPLLAADLIKNLVFQRGEDIGADVDDWSEKYWADFDDDWWRQDVQQGRLFRSRIDLFLQYWLTMRAQEEVSAEKVFAYFRTYSSQRLIDVPTATSLLAELRRDADTFRGFAELDPGSPPGQFYARVVESLELGATIPLLLWLISDNHNVPPEAVARALGAVESWCVRRTLLRVTMKDVNKFMIVLLNRLDDEPIERVGDATVEFLLEQTADSRYWPTDEQLIENVPGSRLYGVVRQNRLVMILSAIERKRRSDRNEDLPIPANLQIEHVMPKKWQAHWADGVTHDPVLVAERDKLVDTIGNLTLLTGSLNASLSNRPWLDVDAAALPSTGGEAGKGKRSLLDAYSLLVLNKEIVQGHPTAWTAVDIAARASGVVADITTIWPRG